MSEHARTAALLGQENMEKLLKARVAVFGLGGVGSYAAEALARGGVGSLVIIDGDDYSESNMNRQLGALTSTLGKNKALCERERLKNAAPNCQIEAVPHFYRQAEGHLVDFGRLDFIIDCIDMVTAKLEIIGRAKIEGVPVISVMGTGNKLFPERLRIGDIFETSVCPLARTMRKELARRNIGALDVVWSDEAPIVPTDPELKQSGRPSPASAPFVPAAAGILAAAHVVRTLAGMGSGGP